MRKDFYPHIRGLSAVFGDFDGSLSNDGDKITLDKPVASNNNKRIWDASSKTIRVVVEEVNYKPGRSLGKME